MQSPEALHIQGVLRLASETERIGVRAERILRTAAMQIARRLGRTGPATQAALEAQLATISEILREAGIQSYDQFIDDLVKAIPRWEGRDAREIRAAVQSAIDQGIAVQTAGTVGPAAGIAVTADLGTQIRLSQQALRTVSRMGPLELAVAGSSKAPYSLGREYAKAFMSPDARSLRQNWGLQVTRLQDIFEQEVRGAVLNGTTNQDLIRNLLGEGGGAGRLQVPLNQLKTVAISGANQTASAVAAQQLHDNKAVEYVRLLATLDQRTSPICRNLDGTIYRKDEAPGPKFHWRCRTEHVAHIPGREPGSRSMTMGVVDDSGKVEFVGAYDSRYADRFTAEQKQLLASNSDGNPPKYADWLKAQPAAAQDSILGQRNGQIYRNTGSLTRATTKANNQTLRSLPTPLRPRQIKRRPRQAPVASPVTAAPPARPAPPPGSAGRK